MAYTKNFIVPEYYLLFECKCGACRTTCCNGWGISLSMDEYFRLLGLDCSPGLRRRLDTAFHLADEPSPERYAMVTPRFDGHCKLQSDDGLCMIHHECGEDMLSAVCRYYPRAPRTAPLNECCTSASCERTLELLFADDKPIKFVETELTFRLDEVPSDVDPVIYRRIRENAINLLEDRSLSFGGRLKKLGSELIPAYKEAYLTKSATDSAESVKSANSTVLLIRELSEQLAHTSTTLGGYLPLCESCYDFAHPESVGLTARLRGLFPALDIYFEKLFVNHIFYKGFPDSFDFISDEHADTHTADEFISLCAVFALTKYISAAYMATHSGLDSFIDVIAAVFRVIEHSRFDECAVRFLRARHADSPTALCALIDL